MTQAPPFQRLSSRGFTLMEMTLVMLVMGLIIGLAAYSFSGVSGEESLRRPASELQKLVLESVRRAALYERSQVIVFDQRGVLLRRPEADAEQASRGLLARGFLPSDDQHKWERRVLWPENMKVKLCRWGQTQFASAAGQQLVIAPGGLCEPLNVRFEQEASWLEIRLDPLSGGVAEESMHVAERGW